MVFISTLDALVKLVTIRLLRLLLIRVSNLRPTWAYCLSIIVSLFVCQSVKLYFFKKGCIEFTQTLIDTIKEAIG